MSLWQRTAVAAARRQLQAGRWASCAVTAEAAWPRPAPPAQRGCLATASSAPLAGALAPRSRGLSTGAEAGISWGAEARNIGEVVAEIRRRGQSGLSAPTDLQPLVDRGLSLASSASLEELAELADAFAEFKLRLPLRDMLPSVTEKLTGAGTGQKPGPEALPSVVRLTCATGRANLFVTELFELLNEQVNNLQARDMALFLYEAGRHGLRTRHFTDAAVERATQLLPQMSISELMWAWQGLIRYSRDRRSFFIAAAPRVQSEVASLGVPQLLLALRASRDLRTITSFVDLHAACCIQLILKVDSMDLNEMAQCLQLSAYSPKYRAQAQALVRSVEQKWSKTEDLSGLRVAEVVDALETFASWGMKPLTLLGRLDQLLVDNQSELKYAGNVSLWVNAVQAFAKMEHYDSQWPEVAMEFARDKLFLERTNFFLQCTLVTSLSKLRLFDEVVYRNVAELLLSDITLFKEVQDLSPVVAAYAYANYIHPELFGRTYDLIIEFMEAETLDLGKSASYGGLIQAAWAFTIAGFHKKYESFAAILDYVLFKDLGELKPLLLRRVVQIADAALQEAPAMAANCQYPERLAEARTSTRIRNIVASEAITEPKLLQDIRTTLQELGWPFEVFHIPDSTAANYVDISLQQKFGQKVGLQLAGRYQTFQQGLQREAQPLRPAGHSEQVKRLLATRGWKMATVEKSQWAALTTPQQRKDFLEALVRRALQA